MSDGTDKTSAMGQLQAIFTPKRLLLLFLLASLLINIYLRTGLLKYQGLFEPDGFMYYTAIKQAIAQHFNFPPATPVLLSGYPQHNPIREAPGILWFVLLPYMFLQYFGVTAYTVIRYIAIVFGILDAIGCYYLVRRISKSQWLGALATIFIALSSGNVARTAGTVFRGDTFVSFFAIVALILLLKIMEDDGKHPTRRYLYAALAGLDMSIGNVIWNGGVLIPMLAFVVATALAAYVFLINDKQGMRNVLLVMTAVLIGFLLYQFWYYIKWANPSVLNNFEFFVVLLPVVVGSLIAYSIRDKPTILGLKNNFATRLGIFSVAGLLAVIVIFILFSSYIITLLTNGNSLYNTAQNIARTTQELQPPTWAFMWASFGIQNFLAPLGVLLFIFLGHRAGNKTHKKLGPLTINCNYGFIACLVYLLMAVYLQASGIRYNSILSIPFALFSAYAIWGGIKALDGYSINLSGTSVGFRHVAIALVFALLVLQFTFSQAQTTSSYQADGINPLFLQAMTWASNYTPTNSRFLALWPDGSVVEGWGNRTSFMDSVGGELGNRIYNFSRWIFNTSPDQNYLINSAYKPDYIVIRNFWFAELGGIAVEGNLTGNLTSYGYDALSSFSASGNATLQKYEFSSGAFDAYLLLQYNSNGSRSIAAFLGPIGSNRFAPLEHIIFYNSTNQGYSVVNSSAAQAINDSLLLTFSGRNITSAAIVGPALLQSNMFKMLILCSASQCAWNATNVTARAVYANADTKIIHLTYH